jgi:HEAT repeats
MTCGEAKELMAAAWQGDHAPGLGQHLETCAECSQEMAALGGLWARMADIPAPEPSQALHARWNATLSSLIPERKQHFWNWRPVWQAGLALAGLLVGIAVGANLPRRGNDEIAKLRREVASTRELVALSLLQQQSATERLRGVDYTGRMNVMEPQVVSALVQAVARDSNVNVRLAAIDALAKAASDPGVVGSLTRSLPQQDSPMVQAALIDYLADAHDTQAVGALRQLAARPDLNPVVLERANLALKKLSH